MKIFNKNNGGFTLIELLVVISIISLLASVILASLNSARAKAQDAARISDIKSVKTALELYYNDNGGYPTSNNSGNGDVPIGDSIIASKLVPTYISSIPAILVADGDHYYANGATSGVSANYDMLIWTYTYANCRSGTLPGNTGDWGVAAVCPF